MEISGEEKCIPHHDKLLCGSLFAGGANKLVYYSELTKFT